MAETVGDILDRMDGVTPTPPKAPEPFVPSVLPDTPPLPAPGIYFGMEEELYHALPALSSHGIRLLAASPMLFWANCTWLSDRARRKEAERQAKPEERMHRTIGKAYHARILEGVEAYQARFAVELSAEECDGALESTDQIKAAIAAAGEKPLGKVPDNLPDGTAYMRAARKEDWAAQLCDIDPEAKVLSKMREDHAKANAGKAFISFDAHEQIEIAAKMIEADEQARHAIRGGYPEVSLIWYDKETGCPMKARLDRLKLKAVVDLKSIGNKADKSIERAIATSIASYKYWLQARLYPDAVEAVKELIRNGGANAPCFKFEGRELGRGVHIETHNWAVKWAREPDPPEFWWLFQATGPAPITRLVGYPAGCVTNMIAGDIIRQAQRKFIEFSKAYGCDPWLDSAPAYNLADEDMPNWATDI